LATFDWLIQFRRRHQSHWSLPHQRDDRAAEAIPDRHAGDAAQAAIEDDTLAPDQDRSRAVAPVLGDEEFSEAEVASINGQDSALSGTCRREADGTTISEIREIHEIFAVGAPIDSTEIIVQEIAVEDSEDSIEVSLAVPNALRIQTIDETMKADERSAMLGGLREILSGSPT